MADSSFSVNNNKSLQYRKSQLIWIAKKSRNSPCTR